MGRPEAKKTEAHHAWSSKRNKVKGSMFGLRGCLGKLGVCRLMLKYHSISPVLRGGEIEIGREAKSAQKSLLLGGSGESSQEACDC